MIRGLVHAHTVQPFTPVTASTSMGCAPVRSAMVSRSSQYHSFFSGLFSGTKRPPYRIHRAAQKSFSAIMGLSPRIHRHMSCASSEMSAIMGSRAAFTPAHVPRAGCAVHTTRTRSTFAELALVWHCLARSRSSRPQPLRSFIDFLCAHLVGAPTVSP